MGFKLPAIETIRGWIRPIKFSPGINMPILTLIEEQVLKMSLSDKDCVIMWDEMSIKQLVQYDKHLDCFEGVVDHGEGRRYIKPATEALVVMVAAIKSNWKCPVSFYFSKCSTTSDDLENILLDNI